MLSWDAAVEVGEAWARSTLVGHTGLILRFYSEAELSPLSQCLVHLVETTEIGAIELGARVAQLREERLRGSG